MGSLLNRSPNALLKFARSDVNDRVGSKARTFSVGKASESQSQPGDIPGGGSQNTDPQRNPTKPAAKSGSAGLLKALSKPK